MHSLASNIDKGPYKRSVIEPSVPTLGAIESDTPWEIGLSVVDELSLLEIYCIPPICAELGNETNLNNSL